MTRLAVALTLLLASHTAVGQTVYPADSGLFHVADFGAVPNDHRDDTLAIQAALNAAGTANRIVFLAPGSYDLSDTLNWPAKYRRLILEGSGSRTTTLRLADRSKDYQDPSQPKAVINTHGKLGIGQGFRNCIRGLTIDIGTGNPGAMGIAFNANNQGSIRDVTIRTSDPDRAGSRGLDLSQNGQIGPLYIADLVVEGFDYGIFDRRGSRSITAVNVALHSQRVAGLLNDGQLWNIEGFTSSGSVTAIVSQGKYSVVNLLDANITLLPSGLPRNAAIVAERAVCLRNVSVAGTRTIVQSSNSQAFADLKTAETMGKIERWTSSTPRSLFADSASAPPYLKRSPEPKIPLETDLQCWANPLDFGAVGDGVTDDTEAIQSAIDAPKSKAIYFPGGKQFRIDGRLEIRRGVNRLIGLESRFFGGGTIVVTDDAAPSVVIERLECLGKNNADRVSIVHNSGGRLLLSSISGFELDRISTSDGRGGDLFLTDVAASTPLVLRKPHQRVFCRQLNIEQQGVNLLCDAATLFVLGYKTEKEGIKLCVRNGGHAELIGAHILSNNPKVHHDPMFQIVDATALLTGVRNVPNGAGDKPFERMVSESRGNQTRELRRSQNPDGGLLPQFVSPR